MKLWRTSAIFVLPIAAWFTGCGGGGKQASTTGSGATVAESKAGHADEVEAKDRPYYDAGRPFYHAIAAREYDRAYEMLSSHAKARISLNQIKPPPNDEEYKRQEAAPMLNVTAQQFAEAMGNVEKQFGRPKAQHQLEVFSTDPAVLSRTSKEETGALDSMFAIGAMPDSIPSTIRKASLRGRIDTELSDSELEKIAKNHGTTLEELKKDEDFQPYLNLKVVLVEESGVLKVGYFEFLSPSMLD